MPNLIEQLLDEPELSQREKADLDMARRWKKAEIEDAIYMRMLDPEYVIDAMQICLKDNVHTQKHMADLIIGHGDRAIAVSNLKLDVLDWIAFKVRQDAERGVF